MAEPIKMLFGLRTRVGTRNHVLDGVQIPIWEKSHHIDGDAAFCQINLTIW